MVEKLERKGPAGCHKSAQLSVPHPLVHLLGVPTPQGFGCSGLLFRTAPLGLGSGGHAELCSAAVWAWIKARFLEDHSSGISLHPSATSNSEPFKTKSLWKRCLAQGVSPGASGFVLTSRPVLLQSLRGRGASHPEVEGSRHEGLHLLLRQRRSPEASVRILYRR